MRIDSSVKQNIELIRQAYIFKLEKGNTEATKSKIGGMQEIDSETVFYGI